MLALQLPRKIGTRLEALAKRTGRTKSFHAREVILQHLAEMEARAERVSRAAQAGAGALAEEARRQSRLVRGLETESETLNWLDGATDRDGWE